MAGGNCAAVNKMHHTVICVVQCATRKMEVIFLLWIPTKWLFLKLQKQGQKCLLKYLILVSQNFAPHGKKTRCQPSIYPPSCIFFPSSARKLNAGLQFYFLISNYFHWTYSLIVAPSNNFTLQVNSLNIVLVYVCPYFHLSLKLEHLIFALLSSLSIIQYAALFQGCSQGARHPRLPPSKIIPPSSS